MLLPPERWADREIFLKQRKEPRCWDGLIVTAKLSHFAIWDLFVSIKNTTFQQKHFFSLKIAPKEETYFDWMITFANSHNFIVVHWHQALLVVARDDAFSSTGSRRRARHLKEEVRTVFWVSKFFFCFLWSGRCLWRRWMFARPKHATGFEVLSTRSAQDIGLRRDLIL